MSVRPDTASQKGGSVRRMLRYALPYTGWFLLALAIIFFSAWMVTLPASRISAISSGALMVLKL